MNDSERSKETVRSGGLKDFVYTKEDLERIRKEDTESTYAFKKVLHTKRYFNEYFDPEAESDLKKYLKFYDLHFDVLDKNKKLIKKFNVICEYSFNGRTYQEFRSKTCSESLDMKLPEGKYRFSFIKKVLLFFNKEAIVKIELNKKKNEKILV